MKLSRSALVVDQTLVLSIGRLVELHSIKLYLIIYLIVFCKCFIRDLLLADFN